MNNLAMHFWDVGLFSKAESLLREYLTIHEEHQPDDWNTFKAQSLLGACLLSQKNYADAEPLLVAGYEGMRQRENSIPVVSRFHLTKGLERLVKLYDEWGKPDEADEWRKQMVVREETDK